MRAIAPVVPFLSEHVWQSLVRAVCPDAPVSIFLAGWPVARAVDSDLLESIAAVRKVIDLGRTARVASRLRVRQPLRRLLVEGASRAEPFTNEVADELRVKEVVFGAVDATELRIRPNKRALGPRLGPALTTVTKALEAGDLLELPGGHFRVAGYDLGPDDVAVQRTSKEGWAVASDTGITVALDTHLDDGLRREGRAYDLIHAINTMRKEAGLEITDRIALLLPQTDADLVEFRDWIAAETLAVSVELWSGEAPQITRTSTSRRA
jgi:isoleucyl-tRNA synthetase